MLLRCLISTTASATRLEERLLFSLPLFRTLIMSTMFLRWILWTETLFSSPTNIDQHLTLENAKNSEVSIYVTWPMSTNRGINEEQNAKAIHEKNSNYIALYREQPNASHFCYMDSMKSPFGAFFVSGGTPVAREDALQIIKDNI
jgi:hypothetical protein